jgi:F-type H+-transporting ATPase subunit b
MLIDWFTVAAQIVNFLVLVALMKHFLYGRLVAAMDAREKGIAARLAEAEQKNKDAEARIEQLRLQALELDRQKDEKLAQAQRDADEQRARLTQSARDSVRKLETKWREDLDRDSRAFLEEFRGRAATEILTVVRRALADLACSDLQECTTHVFLEKLESFDTRFWSELDRHDLCIRSATELTPETRGHVQQVLEKKLGAPIALRFEQVPGMSWGIELRTKGRRVGWSADSYVESLTGSLQEAMAQSRYGHPNGN